MQRVVFFVSFVFFVVSIFFFWFRRKAALGSTLALEQLMTTGGGWQDQSGGIFPGQVNIVGHKTTGQCVGLTSG